MHKNNNFKSKQNFLMIFNKIKHKELKEIK